MLSRHRPGRVEPLLVHEDFDAKIGWVAEGGPGLGRRPALNHRERLVASGLAARLAPARIDVEVRRTLERALENGFGFASAIRLHEKVRGEEDEARVRRGVLERPQPFLGPAERLFRALMPEAELSELEVFPGRRQVLGAQGDARLDIAVALGEAVENSRDAVIVALRLLPATSRQCRQLLPRFGRQPAIFGQSGLAENVGIERGRAVERSVPVPGLPLIEVAGERFRVWPGAMGGADMDVPRALQQGAAFAI